MKNESVLQKEIDLIQGCINRMAHNSFAIKGWLITLVAVILALLPETVDVRILCGVVFAAALCFWYLDAYYLKMERLYRWKYEWVIANRGKSDQRFYDLNPMEPDMWLPNEDGSKKKVPCVVRIMFTKTLIPLYAIIILTCIIFFVFSFTTHPLAA